MLKENVLPASGPVSPSRSPSQSVPPQGPVTLVLTALLPFCAGYFMSFYFRTVNALFASQLTVELKLGAAELGLLTSAYFATAALMQLPVGFALDRFGPRRVQIVSLAIATAGAALFAMAETFWPLLAGRALIGTGVASALVAAIKVAALRFPAERAGLLNGVIVASGALGAIVASAPSEMILQRMNWHEMYVGIAVVTGFVWLLHIVVVPRDAPVAGAAGAAGGFHSVLRDRRFWRFAPMAAAVIGTAWAYHGLWLAVWLADAALKPSAVVVQLLLVTAMTFGAGAVGYGVLLEVLRRHGVGPAPVMVVVALLLVAIELAMAVDPSLPAIVPAAVLGVVSAATVLSFTTLRGLFEVALVGRANGLLNTMNFGMAFAVQSGFGVLVGLGGRDAGGHYIASAFAPALLVCALLKLIAILWYLGERSTAPAQSRHWPRVGYAAVLPLLVVAGMRLAPEQGLALQALIASPATSVQKAFSTPAPNAVNTSPPPQTQQRDALLEAMQRLEAELKATMAREERVLAALNALKMDSESGQQQLKAVALRLVAVEHALHERARPAPITETVAPAPPVVPPASPVASATQRACHSEDVTTASAVVQFGRDQAGVDIKNVSGIDAVVSLVRQCTGLRLLVEGFADPRGSETANRALARRRAEQVAAYLGGRGIDPGRIVVAETPPDDRRPRSRRVDVSVVFDARRGESR